MMLKQTVAARRRHLKTLADVWLSTGASQVTIVDAEGAVLIGWPTSAEILSPALQTPIKQRRSLFGHLQLAGVEQTPLNEQRLAVDAQTIAHFVHLDCDLDQMTQEVVDRQDELVALLELTQSTRHLLDLDELTDTVLRQLTGLFDCQRAFIVSNGELPTAQWPNASLDQGALLWWLKAVSERGGQLIVNRSSAETPLPKNVNNLLVMPLTIRGTISAAIGVVNKADGDFTYPDRKLLSAVSQQVAAQLENALLHADSIQQAKRKHEFELAQDVQMRLLPDHVPSIPYLDVAARTTPAREVGGDFFDYLPSDDGELRFTVGDVSGKGMPAAMLMGMTLTTLRSAASFLNEPSPEAILDHANTALYDDFTEVSMFATVFVGHYDSAFRTVTFANAGHSPVIFCPAAGSADMLEADGTALGILSWCLSKDHSFVLDDGDVLIVASDGFPEATNAVGEMFGYERLMQLVETVRKESAETILQTLCDAIKQFSGDTDQDDDETIMVLKGVSHVAA